jgi:glycosyltransferase involved in cell wall biosynthesis
MTAVTFAVVGHDESPTLVAALAQAAAAASSEDTVVFVDSASTDGSAEVARGAGYAVLPAPLGKGAAVRTLLQQVDTDWVVLLDADLVASEGSLPGPLAETIRAEPDAACVIGDFADRVPGVLSNTWAVYEPLIAELFPEAADRFGSHPLTGFRAVRVSVLGELAQIPDDFGLEAFLNIRAAVSGRPWPVLDLGWYEGRFLYKPTMGLQIGRTILDEAERLGRLAGLRRPAWDGWVAEVVEVIAGYRGSEQERADFLTRLGRARARPLPPRA